MQFADLWVVVMNLRIRVLRTLDECRAIRGDWARLIEMEGEGVQGFDVSATFEWTEALWQWFYDGTPQCVLVAEDDSGIRGILPCAITAETIGRISHRKLALISSVYDLRTGFLVGGNVEVLDCLLAYVFEELEGWDTFVFKVVEESPSDLAVRAVMRRRNLYPHLQRSWSSPYIPIPEDPAQVSRSLKSNMRANVRRRDKQLSNLGKLELRLHDSEASVPVFLDLMMAVEERSWKQDAGTALTSSQRQKKLYATVTPALARHNWFLGAALMLDEQPVAYIYGYAYAHVFVGEKGSYDEQYKQYGPGSVLRARLLEELARRGIRAYDLAGDADPNKAHWTDLSYSRKMHILFNKTFRGQLARSSVMVRKWWADIREAKAN